ncbi:MAG: hypothetical protein E6H66_18545 [Betaproteobacteria bacterium]|nr:MAG: hypothetical protein E6H66_18545 [Betaproteobacteria bacterium]
MTHSTNIRIAALLPSANWPPSAAENCSATPTTSMATTACHNVFDSAVPITISTLPSNISTR